MATDAQAGKDRDTKDTTSAADRAASGGGKSGTGGSGRAGGVGSPGVGGGFDGTGKGSAGNSKDYSGRGGMDSPSEGGPGRGVSGSSSGSAGNAGGEGEGSRYSGRGGLNSPGEVARAADGFGLNGSSVDAPKNYNYSDLGKAGSVGLYSAAQGGPGGPLAGSVGSYSTARGLMGASSTPPATIPDVSYRQMEIQSLKDMALEHLLGTVRNAEVGKVNQYNRMVDKKNATNQFANLTNMTIQEVMDLQKGMIAAGHKSTAVGAYQTIASTLAESVARLGLDPKTTKFDEATQDRIAKDLIDNRTAKATVDGVVDPAKLALGLAQEWASLPTQDGKSYYNDGVNAASKSVSYAGLKDTVEGMVTGKAVKGDLNISPANPQSAATAQAAPKSNLSWEAQQYQYAGQTKQAAPTEVAQYARTARFRDMYISPHLPLNVQGFTEEDVARQTPEVDRVPVGVTTAQTQPAPVPSTPATSAPTTVTTTTAPTALPETSIQPVRTEDRISPTPADDTIEPDKQRSIPAQVAAGGIDVLTGLVPGVGIGASLFNAGAALTGHRTLGERLVDDFLSGDNPGRPAGTRDSDSLLVREDENADGQEEEAEEPAEAAPVAFDKNRFVRKYLTPAEKWGASRGLMTAAS